MENIYYKIPALTLTVEYQTALLDICALILIYFAHALMAAEILRDPTGDTEKLAESRNRCDELLETIKEKDQTCRTFRVIIKADEKSGTDVKDVETLEDSRV
jgi:hypothetical protein